MAWIDEDPGMAPVEENMSKQDQALEGDLVTDIAEFQTDHGDDRPRAVLEWANAARGDRLTLQALRRTGERCGGDDVWLPVGTPLDLPGAG